VFLCGKCTEEERKHFHRRIADGKCGYCGERPIVPGKTFCAEHGPEEE
jgi:hypothetical protein